MTHSHMWELEYRWSYIPPLLSLYIMLCCTYTVYIDYVYISATSAFVRTTKWTH
jgi:hypothetical protein